MTEFHWPQSPGDWSLLVSFSSLGLSVFTLWLTRREKVTVKANFRHRFQLDDRYRFPIVYKRSSPKIGERCLKITVKYSGPHVLRLRMVYYELGDLHSLEHHLPEDAELRNGQRRSYLHMERYSPLSEITAIVVDTNTHGRVIKPVHRILRFQLRVLSTNFRLYRLIQSVTGIPRHRQDHEIDPVVCPNCGAGRELFIDTTSDVRRELQALQDGRVLVHRQREFVCKECSEKWTATSFGPENPEPPPQEPVDNQPSTES